MALDEFRPEIVGIVQRADSRRDSSAVAVHRPEAQRAADGDNLLFEQQLGIRARPKGRAAIADREIDAIGREIRDALGRQNMQIEIGMQSGEVRQAGISHFDANVGVVLMVSLIACGFSSSVARAIISKARRISAM